jgi:hypothetical protein
MAKSIIKYGMKCNPATGKPLGRKPVDPEKLANWMKCQEEANASIATISDDGPTVPDGLIPDDDAELSDEEILTRTANHYSLLQKVVRGSCEGAVRSLIVSGAGGVGKTVAVENIVNHYVENEGLVVEVVKGVISPINLFMLLWRNRESDHLIVLDDADNIFWNEDGLSLLKVALDSSPNRKISWLSQSSALADAGIPNTFKFEGSMIFITNIDFQRTVDSGRGKIAPHLQALMTRTLYVDLKLHTAREVGLWVDYMVDKYQILVGEGLTKAQQTAVMEYIQDRRSRLRNLSIRTALKIATLVKSSESEDEWKMAADMTECR